MSLLGRIFRTGMPFRLTFAQNDSTQAILLKQDEIIDKLNKIAISEQSELASDPSAGGSATEVMSVPGLLSTDTVVSQSITTPGENPATISSVGAPSDDEISVTFSADPGVGAVVTLVVSRETDSKIEKVQLTL